MYVERFCVSSCASPCMLFVDVYMCASEEVASRENAREREREKDGIQETEMI